MTSSTTTSRRACVLALLVGALCVSVSVCGDTPPVQPPSAEEAGAGAGGDVGDVDAPARQAVEAAASEAGPSSEEQQISNHKAAIAAAKIVVPVFKINIYFSHSKNLTATVESAKETLAAVLQVFSAIGRVEGISHLPVASEVFKMFDRGLFPFRMLNQHWETVIPQELQRENVPDTDDENEQKRLLTSEFARGAMTNLLDAVTDFVNGYTSKLVQTFMQPLLKRLKYANAHMNPKTFYGNFKKLMTRKGEFSTFLQLVNHVLVTIKKMPNFSPHRHPKPHPGSSSGTIKSSSNGSGSSTGASHGPASTPKTAAKDESTKAASYATIAKWFSVIIIVVCILAALVVLFFVGRFVRRRYATNGLFSAYRLHTSDRAAGLEGVEINGTVEEDTEVPVGRGIEAEHPKDIDKWSTFY